MTTLKWHPALKKTFKGCEEWWQSSMVKRNKRDAELARLRDDLDREGCFRTDASTLAILSQTYCVEACLTAHRGDSTGLEEALHYGIAFRALDFIRPALADARDPRHVGLLPLWSSMKAVGPTVLSDWEQGRWCASLLIKIAEKDMRINAPSIRLAGWGKGTNDAFLVYLLSEAYAIPTDYKPENELVEPYRKLLRAWRTSDHAIFREAMRAAADFHVSRSKDGTDRNKYEFEKDFDRVFPGELLAVQALRRRDGLPELEAGHLLVDTPWSILRNLPVCEPHPLAVGLEARLRRDAPECWAAKGD